jgi:hypothetical protein
MANAPAGPLDVAAVVAWMQHNPDRLRHLLREEDPDDVEVAPAADPAVRAHLRFVAEAMAQGASPVSAPLITGMADDLDDWFAEDHEVFDEQVERGRGAIALEEQLLSGADHETEPVIHAALERRVRLGAWNRLFLRCLESRLGPDYDGLTEAALDWSKAHERDLASAILQMHHRALRALAEATGQPATAEERDQSSQAAAVRGHARHLVDAVAHALAAA